MPQYAGNLYNQSNATEVAVNTQRAQPSSLFGTRQLKFFSYSMYWCLYTNTQHLQDNALGVTGGSADGQQVTYEFATQSTAPYAVGDTIYVYSMDHNQYNGEFTVVAATNSSVTVDWFRTGDTVTGGSIVRVAYMDPDSAYSYIVRAIQKVAEIYYLGRPSYQDIDLEQNDFGSFVFAISDDLTTTDYDESGYYYPGYTPITTVPTDLASAINEALNTYASPHTFFDWGNNGDGWSLTVLDDLGWGFAPGQMAGDTGFGLINFQP
jgi:hypothetical protein